MTKDIKNLKLAEKGLAPHQYRIAEFIYLCDPPGFYNENTVEKEGQTKYTAADKERGKT